MMREAVWKWAGMFDADAQRVADEIASFGDSFNVADVVAYARNEETELHKCFEWDDTVAAEQWRLQQARTVMTMIIYKDSEVENVTAPIRLYVSNGKRNEYAPTRLLVKNDDSYQRMLEAAKSELAAFTRKYKTITELRELIEEIESYL